MDVITIERKVLEKNDELAGKNRQELTSRGITTLNLISSPGSGKTSILERTLDFLKESARIAVIEGDVQTDNDARRIARHHVPVVQIVTNGGCHLDAKLVEDAMTALPLGRIDLLIIENVGNLVCPSGYDLGENKKVVVLSVTEGEDKPLKYPSIFRNAHVMIVNKVDLLPHLKFNVEELKANALQVNPALKIFDVSCTTGEGIPAWSSWIMQQVSLTRSSQISKP
jgi:hydrogenase nickel incorporation protein HypB